MKLSDLIVRFEALAPLSLAESWDNVGLLVGDPSSDVSRVLFTIDATREVLDEAVAGGFQLVYAYHPPIFKPVKSVLAGSLAFRAVREGIALYSPHTALDVADGGTNDVLADLLSMTDRGPLKVATPKDREHKLVTFVPEDAVSRVSDALFAAGAGRIGKYSACSFRSRGQGTFFGEAGSNPAVGESGRLETAEEVRLETVVPLEAVEAVVRALRQAHPYEEPAFDLVRLSAAPVTRGLGRIGALPGIPREELLPRIKAALGIEHLLVAGPTEGPVHRAAVCAGACGDLLDEAMARKADLYLTGELRHHDALRAAERGMTVVATLHSNSERAALSVIAARFRKETSGVDLVVSLRDRDPFRVVLSLGRPTPGASATPMTGLHRPVEAPFARATSSSSDSRVTPRRAAVLLAREEAATPGTNW
jgi:dinuclear metal center YbgI/SA1388 family protein